MNRLLVSSLAVAFAAVAVLSGQQMQTRLFGIGPAPATFFDDSTLQEVRLSISSRDWEALKEHFDENTYYPADFRWHNEVVRNIGIRSRGVKSRSSVKPGLRVDFDRYTTGQRFLGLKSVVLRNNTLDASNLNERLSTLLFRRMGLPVSREAHTTFYVNNEYAGRTRLWSRWTKSSSTGAP
jgi:spore coat protein CotH